MAGLLLFTPNKMPKLRILFVASYFPPVSGGAAMTLARLVDALQDYEVAVVSEHPKNFEGIHNAQIPAGIVTWKVRALHSWIHQFSPSPFRKWARRRLAGSATQVIRRAIKDWRPSHVVAVYPSATMLESAWRAVAGTGCLLVPYFFDDPEGKLPHVLNDSAAVLALTRGVQASILEKTGQRSIHVPHIAPEAPAQACRKSSRIHLTKLLNTALDGRHVIAHTGSVEGLQIDGLRDMIEAMRQWPGREPLLVISTPSPAEAKYALAGAADMEQVRVLNLSPSELVHLQVGADLLLAILPLEGDLESFGRTCFPTKIMDYLNCGTPMVVRGPAGSVLCQHASSGGYAAVVTEKGPTPLLEAAASILGSKERQALLLQHARKASLEFSAPSIVPRFLDALNRVSQPHGDCSDGPP